MIRSWTLMVRSAAKPRVSNHEAARVFITLEEAGGCERSQSVL
jgi:hypothetical protein